MTVMYSNQSVVAVAASTTGTTTAIAATLPAVPGKVTYLSGFTMNAGATAGTATAASITGLAVGTLNFLQPIGATATPAVLTVNLDPPLPASATNTTIVVNSGAAGTAGTNSVTAWGFQQ